MRKCTPFLLFLFIATICTAQEIQPPYLDGEIRLESFKDQRQTMAANTYLGNIAFESVGPSVFGGRITDIDVDPKDPTHFYVAYASGGLWETKNNGTSFTPIFENEAVITIGDFAVDWSNNNIWIGTGENNSSRSSYAGVGMYQSSDNGTTWNHKGLPESHHIGRVLIHPTDPNTIWVAVLGHLYSPNKERGIYKSTDGGNTWELKLFVNENAGAIDLIIDPDNPDILYTSFWHRERRSWNFVESGLGSGIHKSIDGGNTWTLLTTEKSGLPTGEGLGRIGLTISKANGKTILYTLIDNYDRRPKKPKEDKTLLTKEDFRNMSKEDFLKLKEGKLEKFLRNNGFPKKYSSEKVTKLIKKDKIKPVDLTTYLEDANSLLFDTPVVGAEVYRSDDEGISWKKTHDDFLDNVYNSYGYYFGLIRISPQDPDKIYIAGVPVLRSEDGGKTFKSINGDNVHVDHHALWANPNRPGHLILGNDGGINISYDDGELWIKCNSPAVGQFYYVNVDMQEPYNIYGGLQDNGVWVGSSKYKAGNGWHNSGHYPYKSVMGGDGMQIAIDTRDNQTIYTGYQFGNYFRINQRNGKRKYITPKHELGDRPLRWNWQTPIHLSVHNQDILYMGSNKVHRSMKQGDDFETISEDLTFGGKKGDVAFGTLTCLHESSLKFGLLYVGSDDGRVHVSKDGGNNWTDISKGLPADMWVTRIQASAYEESVVYVSLNGYRWDDFRSYLYSSDDYGATWTKIGNDIPHEPINVVKEDPKNEDILYVGTDNGLYVSMNRGYVFNLLNKGLPAVAVHDLVIHPKANELIVATHGRSFYKADVSTLQQMEYTQLEENLLVFDVDKTRHSSFWGNSWSKWSETSKPKFSLPFFISNAGEVSLTIKSKEGLVLHQSKQDFTKGLNWFPYNLTLDAKKLKAYEKELNEGKKDDEIIKLKKSDDGQFYLQPGKYEGVIVVGRHEKTVSFVLE